MDRLPKFRNEGSRLVHGLLAVGAVSNARYTATGALSLALYVYGAIGLLLLALDLVNQQRSGIDRKGSTQQ